MDGCGFLHDGSLSHSKVIRNQPDEKDSLAWVFYIATRRLISLNYDRMIYSATCWRFLTLLDVLSESFEGHTMETKPIQTKCFECDLGDKVIFIFADKKVSNDTGVAFFKGGNLIVHVQAKRQILTPDQEHA